MTSVLLMNAEYSNKNLKMLAENVYTDAAPIMRDINGKKILVMLWDNDKRIDVNRTMLVYSVYSEETKEWSAPMAVSDDGTADFYPCFNDGYLIWQNEKSLLDDNMTLSDIAKQGEICVSKWNGSGFDEPVSITNNEKLDTQPYVCTDGSKVSAIWTSNTEDDILGINGTNTIMQSDFNGTDWSEPISVKSNINAITNISAGYIDNILNIAYVADDDNDLQTINDRDICIISDRGEIELTDNVVLDRNPVFNKNLIYYYSGGNIAYSSIDKTIQGTVFAEAKADLTDTFTVDSNVSGDIAIWWMKSVQDDTEIFCVLNKDNEWSNEIQITDIGNQSRYPTGILEENGTMSVAFNNSIWQYGDIIQSNLYILNLTPSYDLSIIDAYMDEDTMTAYATVQNTGELTIDAYTVKLTDTTVNAEKTITEPIRAGETSEINIQYVKPENLNKRNIVLDISTDVGEEYNLENNTYTLTVGNCDIEITSVDSYEQIPDAYVAVVISNVGYNDTGIINVNLRKATVDGEIVSSQTIINLSAGMSETIMFGYNAVDNKNIQWYITAEAENEEISLGNNDKYFVNGYINTVDRYSHEILRYSYEDKVLSVIAYLENNTAVEENGISVLGVYSSAGMLKGIVMRNAQIDQYGSSSINFTLSDYTYESGDYMKLFLWDDMSPLMPLCQTQSKILVLE